MANSDRISTPGGLGAEVKELKIEEDIISEPGMQDVIAVKHEQPSSDREFRPGFSRRTSRAVESPRISSSKAQSPAVKSEKEEVIGGDIALKIEPGEAPKLTRKQTQKVPARPPPLFSHLEDATPAATSTFEVMAKCHYAAKYLGYTEPPLECDCSEEWGMLILCNSASTCFGRLGGDSQADDFTF